MRPAIVRTVFAAALDVAIVELPHRWRGHRGFEPCRTPASISDETSQKRSQPIATGGQAGRCALAAASPADGRRLSSRSRSDIMTTLESKQLFRTALYVPLIVMVLLGVGSNGASARPCSRDGSACRGSPMARANHNDARQHQRSSIVRISPATAGCYGFDHGPVYHPGPCHFPYNCEMFDGACGGSRPWADTIRR
jgi:hypothetical protein